MKKILYPIIFSISLLLTLPVAIAAPLATVSLNPVYLGESFQLTLELPDNDTQVNLGQLNSNFDVYGTSRSSQMQMINGKTSSSIKLVLTLMAKKTGQLTIPALNIGKQSSDPIALTVKPRKAQPKGNPILAQLNATASSRHITLGQPILYTLKLRYGQAVQEGQIIPPTLPSATLTPIGEAKRSSTTEHGVVYQTLEQRYQLVAKTPGPLTISPSRFQGAKASGKHSSFFVFASSEPFEVASKPISIQINPAPAGINHDTFLPADQVQIIESWTPKKPSWQVGEPITRTVTVLAVGGLSANIPNLTPPHPQGVNSYPDQSQSTDQLVQGRLTGVLQQKVAYVATKAGKITFPTIKLSWWDAKTQQQKVATLPEKSFTVKAAPNSNKQAIAALPSPIIRNNPTVMTPSIQPITTSNAHSIWPWLGPLFAVLWVITSIVLIYVITHKNHQPITTEQLPKLKQSLRKVKRFCHDNDAKGIEKALLAWAKVYWPESQTLNLSALSEQLLSEDCIAQIKALESALYKSKPYNQGPELWSSLTESLKQNPKTREEQAQLASLY